MENEFLIGRDVYLRPVEPADAPRIAPWINDPEVNRTSLRRRPMSLRGEEEFIERMNRSEADVLLGIALRDGDALIGLCGLHHIDPLSRHALLGLLIGEKEQWNKGRGSDATLLLVRYGFRSLNLHRIALHVFEDNLPAIRIYEKIGFRREGLLRQDVYREGKYENTVVMGILQDEVSL